MLWSIALPGFGQLLNGKYVKGFVLIAMEFLVNMMAHLNLAIKFSFQGDAAAAVGITDYQWLMFYPCLYMFGIWDSFKDSGGGRSVYATLPFVGSAYLGTVGIIYSDRLKVGGVLWGPVWLPMGFALAGVALGLGLRLLLERASGKTGEDAGI